MEFSLKNDHHAKDVIVSASLTFEELNEKVFDFLASEDASPDEAGDAGQQLHHFAQYSEERAFIKELTKFIYGDWDPEKVLWVGRMLIVITDSQDPCPDCGAETDTDYDGDDFTTNTIKRTVCRNPNCDWYHEDTLTRAEMNEP